MERISVSVDMNGDGQKAKDAISDVNSAKTADGVDLFISHKVLCDENGEPLGIRDSVSSIKDALTSNVLDRVADKVITNDDR
ncbi:MAG: hypothetical protein FWE97_04020 [Dehalococcoidia bacterium]|nr:hypothetical protein [Dehalococcoidia bacterium]